MASDMLTNLRTLDTTVLGDVVRQDQQEPDLEITEWTVKTLSTKGIKNTDGLFLFSGKARAGESVRLWSVVLKILKKPDDAQEPHELWYWKREVPAAQTGLLTGLPGPVAAPRFYGITEYEDSAWMWMEHIHEAREGIWALEDYAFAARQLGQFNGAYLTRTPVPTEAWFCQSLARQWTEVLNPEHAWENPFVNRYFSPEVRTRVTQLWSERERFYNALGRLPQIFSHFDCQRRNLLIRQAPAGQQELVAIDWAWCGTGPVGGEMYALIGGSSLLFEWEPLRLHELEEAAFEAYVTGLRDAGWHGDADLARLGYTTWLALFCGVTAPALAAFWCCEERRAAVSGLFGRTLDQAASGWAALCAFSLDRADEARKLMAKLPPAYAEVPAVHQEPLVL